MTNQEWRISMPISLISIQSNQHSIISQGLARTKDKTQAVPVAKFLLRSDKIMNKCNTSTLWKWMISYLVSEQLIYLRFLRNYSCRWYLQRQQQTEDAGIWDRQSETKFGWSLTAWAVQAPNCPCWGDWAVGIGPWKTHPITSARNPNFWPRATAMRLYSRIRWLKRCAPSTGTTAFENEMSPGFQAKFQNQISTFKINDRNIGKRGR